MQLTFTTKRYYQLAGIAVAVRDSAGSGSLNYLLGDQLGSTTTSVNASTGASATQRFLPYGAPRSGGITATDRGWIGQTRDASTGLQHLNARYYDPTVGRFAATDPLANLGEQGSLDGYGYGLGNPVTLSDPSGLYVELENSGSLAFARLQQRAGTAIPGPLKGVWGAPVTGRFHGRWPQRTGFGPNPKHVLPPPVAPQPASSTRLDGLQVPGARRPAGLRR